MSVPAIRENALRGGAGPFEMVTVSTLGMAGTARRALATPAKSKGRD